MTTNSKKNTGIVTALKGLLPYFATPAMLVFIIWNASKWEDRQFDNIQQKAETVRHVEEAVSELEHYKAMQTIDTVLDLVRDYQKETDARRKKNDSLDLLDKATRFQQKEELKQIREEIQKLKENGERPNN